MDSKYCVTCEKECGSHSCRVCGGAYHAIEPCCKLEKISDNDEGFGNKVLYFGCSSKSDHEIVEIYTPPVTKKQKSLFSFFKPHLSEPGSSLKHKKK